MRAEEDLDVDTADPFADLPWSHTGEPAKDRIKQLVASGTPIFSTFAGTKVEGAKLRRIVPELHLGDHCGEHMMKGEREGMLKFSCFGRHLFEKLGPKHELIL